jgi:hypothetical protein
LLGTIEQFLKAMVSMDGVIPSKERKEREEPVSWESEKQLWLILP